ncbi:MAG: YhcH/YjgK/YiaL family protein [Neisseriaceae bacterium]|nr:YhcH/YjgK/YiaL family protein [Neisseriaceae bacterium]
MIYDSLDHLRDYLPLMPQLETVLSLLNQPDFADKMIGRYETNNPAVRFNIDEYETVLSPKDFEFHRKYADVQIVLQGQEIHHIAPRDDIACVQDFDEEKDIAFFDSLPIAEYVLEKGYFCIYFPNEPHRSQLAVDERDQVKKVVFKIRIN